jgi:hypothetical protein
LRHTPLKISAGLAWHTTLLVCGGGLECPSGLLLLSAVAFGQDSWLQSAHPLGVATVVHLNKVMWLRVCPRIASVLCLYL